MLSVDNRKYWLITWFCIIFSVITFGIVLGVYFNQIKDKTDLIDKVDYTIQQLKGPHF